MSTESRFVLHPRLAGDCALLGDSLLSRVLIMNDRRFPWIVLVPRRADLSELHHLSPPDRATLLEEIEAASRALLEVPPVSKINVGALGNVVPQLHVHVVGRHPDDAAWPGPVWGHGPAEPYPPAEADALLERLRPQLERLLTS